MRKNNPLGKIFIDIGSSTTKIYSEHSGALKFVGCETVPLKDGFDSKAGISTENKNRLFKLVNQVRGENKEAKVKIYATGIFRKMNEDTKTAFVDEFFRQTGLFFNIISQDLENFYLEMALIGKCGLSRPILLINIGGGSTELVVVKKKWVIERRNIDLGVGTINSQFPSINDPVSQIGLKEVIASIKKLLPNLTNQSDLAFYTGGELTYMKLAQYALTKNWLFPDKDHPSIIGMLEFAKRNREIFSQVTLGELESLMPDNPLWVHGARGCSAIAQAICEKYKIKTIIPSDSNLVHGAVRQEFRTAVISGSFRQHLKQILKLKEKLEKQGVEVLSPRFTKPKNPGEKFVVFNGEEGLDPLELERYHLKSIADADVLIVVNPKGYVGASALIEVGFANMLAKRIIFLEKPDEFMLNTLPAEVGL